MKNIAIIPARSGSKGLKNKNILTLNSIPLLAYSIIAAKESKLFDEIVVSTDSKEYADIAINWGASVPFLRSEKNSDDTASSWDVVLEVLNNYSDRGIKFDTVTLLQPTSPLRTSDDIIQAFELYNKKEANAITSVCEVDHSPLWCMTLTCDNSLTEFRKSIQDRPRQSLSTYYRLNGAIYIRKIQYNDDAPELLSDKEFAYIMHRNHSIDIDTIDDFKLAEFYLSNI